MVFISLFLGNFLLQLFVCCCLVNSITFLCPSVHPIHFSTNPIDFSTKAFKAFKYDGLRTFIKCFCIFCMSSRCSGETGASHRAPGVPGPAARYGGDTLVHENRQGQGRGGGEEEEGAEEESK